MYRVAIQSDKLNSVARTFIRVKPGSSLAQDAVLMLGTDIGVKETSEQLCIDVTSTRH
jgi:hypothetical protein